MDLRDRERERERGSLELYGYQVNVVFFFPATFYLRGCRQRLSDK